MWRCADVLVGGFATLPELDSPVASLAWDSTEFGKIEDCWGSGEHGMECPDPVMGRSDSTSISPAGSGSQFLFSVDGQFTNDLESQPAAAQQVSIPLSELEQSNCASGVGGSLLHSGIRQTSSPST